MPSRYDAVLAAVPILLALGWFARPALAVAPVVDPGAIPYAALGLGGALVTVGVALALEPGRDTC